MQHLIQHNALILQPQLRLREAGSRVTQRADLRQHFGTTILQIQQGMRHKAS